ncbi:fimbrial protein [Ewingella americana]
MKKELIDNIKNGSVLRLFVSSILLGIISWLATAPVAMAANNCTITQGKAVNVSLSIPTLRPSKNGTSGTVLARAEVPTAAISYTCGNLIRDSWRSRFTRSESTQQALDNVYNTNVAGVGIRLSWPASRSMYFPNTAECISSCIEPADKVTVEFVQTGVIDMGTIPAGTIGEVNLTANTAPGPDLTLMTISLAAPIDVAAKSCAILTTSQNVALGEYALADFQSRKVRMGGEVSFKLTVDCPQKSSVQFKFTASNRPTGSAKGYIPNCDDDDCAQSVGVRLLNNSSSAVYTDGTAVDATGATKGGTTSITGEKSFTYKAQIYPSDIKTMTAGKIDTHVVFDVLMN